MLQGTLAASAGLSQAIVATAPLSPLPLRGAASRLAGRLSAGMHPRDALQQFADELDDPCADRVVCALQLAVTSRAQRMGDLLAALADSTRDEVALRLRIETSRASVRSGVRTVLVFSVAFAVGLTFLAHPYLAPFDSGEGQIVLAGGRRPVRTGADLDGRPGPSPGARPTPRTSGGGTMSIVIILGAVAALGCIGAVGGMQVTPPTLESIAAAMSRPSTTGIDPAAAGAARTHPWRPWTRASRALASWGKSAAASHPTWLALATRTGHHR